MRRLAFLFVLFLTAGVMAKAADVTFKAVAPNAVVMGQQFRLAYTVNAEAKASDLRIPELTDFEVLMGPSLATSSSTQIINGNVSSEVAYTFTYILMPKKEGTFNIGAASIKVKGANYTSNSLSVKVLPPDKAAEANGGQAGTGIGKDDYFVRMEVSNRNVYEQEGILVTFKLYVRKDIGGIDQPKFPEFTGFLAQEVELPQNKQLVMENYKGKNYGTAIIKQTVLYPQRSGKITIPSGKLDIVLRVPGPARQRSSVFDDFFGSSSYIDVKKELTTPPVTIDVKPLPSGKPASFSGAVGNFTMTSSISSNNVKTDDAVTVKVKISGNGNIKLVKNPEVAFPNDFDVYDPKVEVDIKTTAAGTSGTKTIEYMAIPRYAGDFEIPAVAFSYFDTKTGSYKTITSEPYKLHVEQGKGGGNIFSCRF